MHSYRYVTLIITILGFASCGQSGSKYKRLVEERDSLKIENEAQTKNLNSIVAMIDTINSVLDSITLEEGVLFLAPTQEVKYVRSKTLQDLDRFEHVLRHQQRKIDELDSILNTRDDKQKSMQVLVANLRGELEKKDIQIAKLRNELTKKNRDIYKLRKEVENQQATIALQEETINNQTDRIEEQKNVIARQDEMMNNCYILIASKKDLAEKGITTKKALLKGNKLLNEREFDNRYFQRVDIRQCTELTFEAKKPRVLTNMPKNSYILESVNKGVYCLSITNSTSFWSISSYLIIQTD